VQHALRAFTPRDQKAVKTAAETFRPNPKLDTAKVITELGKGEALVSFLEGNGTPSMVERALICPPSARIGPVMPAERKAIIGKSPLRGKYDQTVDPDSAYEMLQRRVAGAEEAPDEEAPTPTPSPWGQPGQTTPQTRQRRSTGSAAPPPAESSGGRGDVLGGILGGGSSGGRPRGRMSTGEVVVKQVARSVASQVGTQIGKALIRGVLGSLTGKR
jgi:hypothetical protein